MNLIHHPERVPRTLRRFYRLTHARQVSALGLVFFTLCSCSDRQSISPHIENTSKWLTPEAASHLDANGNFVLATAAVGELSEGDARALALAYFRVGSRWLANTWQEDRGESIDFDKLSLCPRAYYAHALLQPGAASGQALREFVGPQWLFSACSASGVQVVSIAVSALANELRVVDGRLLGSGGGQFFSAGIPTFLASAPITPEEAAKFASEATGQLVAHAPELVLPPTAYPPQLAKWRVQLAEPVSLEGQVTRKTVTTSEVFIGPADTWRSTDIQIGISKPGSQEVRDPSAQGVLVSLSPFHGYPTAFERAQVNRQ